MNDKEKKAIEKIEKHILIGECEKAIGVPIYISDLKIVLNLIEKQKAEIEKKDKRLNRQFKLLQKKDKEIKCLKCLHNIQVEIIDLMAEEFVSKTLMYSDMTKEEVKEYFENKAEEDKDEK